MILGPQALGPGLGRASGQDTATIAWCDLSHFLDSPDLTELERVYICSPTRGMKFTVRGSLETFTISAKSDGDPR